LSQAYGKGRIGEKMKTSNTEKIFYAINYFLLFLVGMVTLYPFIYVLSASVSSPDAVITGKVLLLPKDITWGAYKKVLSQNEIWTAYGNTFYYTLIGTAVNILFTICGAYPLAKKRLRAKSFISFFIVFTMWFDAGIIPFYLNIKDLHLLDTRMAIILGFACQAFYIILLRNFFEAIPDALEESGRCDGANDLQILIKIYLPLAKPALATIALFYAVERWNGYFWAMVLLKDDKKIPLQVLLKKLIVEANVSDEYATMANISTAYSKETIIYATIFISIIPMLIVYPYIQKYFVKGVMVGAVKG